MELFTADGAETVLFEQAVNCVTINNKQRVLNILINFFYTVNMNEGKNFKKRDVLNEENQWLNENNFRPPIKFAQYLFTDMFNETRFWIKFCLKSKE